MPYYIAVYDVNTKRLAKMLKLFRSYMTWVQNSVFEGEMTKAQFQELKSRAKKIMNKDEDSVILYELRTEKYLARSTLGVERGEPGRIL